MAEQPLVLDCTLRDGGYYNDWDFPRPLVQGYLSAMHSTGIKARSRLFGRI